MKIYVAKVKKNKLSDDGRGITAYNNFIPLTDNIILPALDGFVKLPCPAVDDQVLVFDADSSNSIRWYIPLNKAFATLTDAGTKLQIESPAEVEIDGTAIKLGVAASDFVALATNTEARLAALEALAVAHVHGGPGTPTVPPPVLNTPPAPVAATKTKAE